MSRRKKKSDPVWEGYRRAKRCVRPMPLRVGSEVIYEDADGRVHQRTFIILTLTRTSASIKGWPDGVRRRGPRKRLVVPCSALVRADHVCQESFKAALGIPEDIAGECYVVTDADLRALTRRRRTRTRGRRG